MVAIALLLLCLCTRSAGTMDQSTQTDITWSHGRLPSWLTRLKRGLDYAPLPFPPPPPPPLPPPPAPPLPMMTCRHNFTDESQSDITRLQLPQHHHPPAVLPEERREHCSFPRHRLLLSPCASPRRDQRGFRLHGSRSASRRSRKSKSTPRCRPFTATRRSRSPRTNWTRCRHQCQYLPPGHRRCLAPCARRKPEHVHCRCWAHCGR